MDADGIRSLAKTYVLLADVLEQLRDAGIPTECEGDVPNTVRMNYEWEFPAWIVTGEFACCDYESIQFCATPKAGGDSVVWDYERQSDPVDSMVRFVTTFDPEINADPPRAISYLMQTTSAGWWSERKDGNA
jgi:hypothetical protein